MNNILQVTKKSFLIFAVTLFFSCEKNVEEDLIKVEDDSCNPETSFVETIKPIIDNNCIECHNGNQFPDLRTFSGISENAINVRTQVVSLRMPQGGSLTTEEIDFIRCWVDNGAQNN